MSCSFIKKIISKRLFVLKSAGKDVFQRFIQWAFIFSCILMIAALIIYPYTQVVLPENATDLAGAWKIILEDKPEFPDTEYDYRSWDSVTLLESFMGYAMIFHVGAIFLFTGAALVFVTRFIAVSDEVVALNVSLENFIMENTLLSEKIETLLNKKQATTISPVAEEKIKNVIRKINSGYTEEMTRDDLADFVGVHPDSLGRQFKKYTGYKLSDYINELRINEAARRLREENTHIIDIAFEVGFESVRTFNRAFPKFMNETPYSYRKIFQGGGEVRNE